VRPIRLWSANALSEAEYTQTLVVASIKKDDTRWVPRDLPFMNHAIYVADDISAPLHPPKNKGRETMMYLTYIIDNYHNLSDTTIFIHADQKVFHNNELQNTDLSVMLRQLSNVHVQRVGFFNLRCNPRPGCPEQINPYNTQYQHNKIEQSHYHVVWPEIFGPDVPMPHALGAPCCAQFAVSKKALRSIPLQRWEHYRQWLLDTPIDDATSGRIWEYLWHFVLSGKGVLCPPIDVCYCEGYGMCFNSASEVMAFQVMSEVQEIGSRMLQDFKERGKDTLWEFDYWQRLVGTKQNWRDMARWRGREMHKGRFDLLDPEENV
jgi:hypothetical protein